ncbi:MAG: alpha-galactosidase [Chloroflexi bacterium]|nr:alpha-galactosidase [Chloroflexota bacterium]
MTSLQFSDIQTKSQIIKAKEIHVELPSQPVKYYRHGWQSWSLAAWTDPSPIPVPKPAIFHPLQLDAEHVHKKYLHGSWLGAVEFADGNILLLGALATDANVSLQDQLSGRSEAGEVEWFIAFGKENSVFEEYAAALGIRFGETKKNIAPRVWCSWYSLYTAIDEQTLYKIFDDLGDLPFDVLQVDDGWQMDIGDWEANAKFPSGMKTLADKIKSTGRRAGLWLAPLIATKSSKLFREHPDWFLRNEAGKFVSAGFNWGERLYALDTTHPDVTSWLVALMKQVRAWGFDYLKLDFLFGGALKGKRFKDMPREAAYRECLKTMREAMGADAFFLTCGTPILPALGLCDAMRIGPDVAHFWEKYRDAYLLYNPTIPGTKNAIRTTLHRLWLKPLLHIDPDVAYFESKANHLTHEQRLLLQNLAYVCEFKATSDLPQWLGKEERSQLDCFLNLNPKIEQTGRYTFRIDDCTVDFASVTPLPDVPTGLTALWGRLVGWLGDRYLLLRMYKILNLAKLRKRKSNIL